jgi:hypothetical protein
MDRIFLGSSEGNGGRNVDMDMSIASLSVDMAQAKTQQQLGIAILKEAMETSGEAVAELLENVPENLTPDLGAEVDIMA